MIEPTTYLLFLAASAAIVLVPGPAQALVLASTLSGGPRAGALTAVGLNLGTLGHAAFAALGVSAVLAASATAFAVVKYVGAAYLVWLGVAALRSRESPQPAEAPVRPGHGAALAQAVAAGLLNPKVALFFLAFLPQFVDPSRGSVFAQFLLLGATVAIMDTLYELLLVAVAHRVRSRLASGSRWDTFRRRASGLVLVGLGVRLALQER